MTPRYTTHWTIVQHSGIVHDSGFRRGVEEASIATAGQERRVRAAGGIVFTSYREASRFAMIANYPPEVEGLYPNVRGKFAQSQLDGRRVYIPDPDDVVRATQALEEDGGA
jgi:hypothetical protein